MEIPIAFTYILIFFIILITSFVFCSSESLDKNDKYYYFITKLDVYTFVLDEMVAMIFNSRKERY